MEQGSFDSSPEHYKTLVQELEKTCGTIELPSEYAYFFKDNLLQLLIRLARYKFACRLIKPDDRVTGCWKSVAVPAWVPFFWGSTAGPSRESTFRSGRSMPQKKSTGGPTSIFLWAIFGCGADSFSHF